MASEVTEAVIAHPVIQNVEFVGSAAVGCIVGQLCSKYLNPIFIESGGKGLAIFLDDVDLSAAAKWCIAGGAYLCLLCCIFLWLLILIITDFFSAYLHHGQLCFSTKRIIVLESVASEFQKLLIKEAESFSIIDGVSPQIVEACWEKLLDAQRKGAIFLVGKPEKLGLAKLHPTIVLGLTKDVDLYNEESFGPSAALFVAQNDQHTIDIANDSPYGLNTAIHTKDFHRAWLPQPSYSFCGTPAAWEPERSLGEPRSKPAYKMNEDGKR